MHLLISKASLNGPFISFSCERVWRQVVGLFNWAGSAGWSPDCFVARLTPSARWCPRWSVCWSSLLSHFFLVFFLPRNKQKFWISVVNILHKASSVPPNPSLKRNMEFLVWFSAGLSCYLIWGVLLEAGVSRQSWPQRGGMWGWRHSRSWECFAFLFLAVVRWLPARMKDNSFQRRKRERRKRTVYNQTVVGEALLFWAKTEIRSRCLTFWCCTNVKCILLMTVIAEVFGFLLNLSFETLFKNCGKTTSCSWHF